MGLVKIFPLLIDDYDKFNNFFDYSNIEELGIKIYHQINRVFQFYLIEYGCRDTNLGSISKLFALIFTLQIED